jgi:integrase/recombinase XerD
MVAHYACSERLEPEMTGLAPTPAQDEIEQFNLPHTLGTQTRLALDILRYTTGRREDAPRLGRQHIRDERIKFRKYP